MFGQHVSPVVVEAPLAQHTEITSQLRTVCVVFIDISDFTMFVETRDSTQVVNYLNTLFAGMIESINRHHGIINTFLGDRCMAVFGAPVVDEQACRHAVAPAPEIVQTVEDLNRSGQIPSTRACIGIHTGEAITGNVGSPVRKEYMMIGDTVNLAARIEQLNMQYGSTQLISKAIWAVIYEPGARAIALTPVHVKGRRAPVQVFRLA